ncbi:MAG: hypothetical protein U9O95_02605 [Candidatus Marinimicrobia bacterium]|nr:hypothetical protein [Candidatus Neomarinimicrobiota bacterium]
MSRKIRNRGLKLRSTHQPISPSTSTSTSISTLQRFNASTFPRFFRLALMFILITFLSSCIEYREELWLNNDNSGRLTFEIGLPSYTSIEDDEISELSIITLCDTVEGLTVTGHSTYMIEDITWIHIDLEFKDVLLLNDIDNEWFGEIYITDDDEGNRILKRYITMSDTINVSSNEFGNMLKHAMLGQYSWIYTMHFPDDLYETNAPIARTDTLTNTAIWEYNLASLINEQKIMTGRYRHRQGLKGIFRNLFKR